ncbi:VOC family protein [uncultured Shewanella sp.]|uniref:VOC family protein n=1 Tax=uncultured Shewanella sp. TaxID=173975 RepID=UPI002631DB62|nr:VOC family protein [uncultured Shewanella sp.]
MKRFHVALAVKDIDESILFYSQKIGCEPEVVVPREYALWRTEMLNFSIRLTSDQAERPIRHLGWEDPKATGFICETDINGVHWEEFSQANQHDEILSHWPDVVFDG